MAFFSRRPKPTPADAPKPAEEQTSDAAAPDAAAESAPDVSISLSAFRGVGAPTAPASAPTPDAGPAPAPAADPGGPSVPAPPRPRVPAEAPQAAASAGGLRDNAVLAQALGALSATPSGPELLNVVRQLLQGHVFLRVQGDARALLAEGKPLPLSVGAIKDERYVLVYSGGAALQASVRSDGATDTSAIAQPVLAVLRHALEGDFGGIILDNNSAPNRAVLPRAVLERAMKDIDEQLRLKTLLAAPRTDATASEIAAALAEVPLWVAVKRTSEDGPLGAAESRTAQGERYLEVFSHPLESIVLNRGDAAAPLTPAQLATVLAKDVNLAGVLLDPAGPWIRLTRADLAPLLALAV